ncbi:anaerobic ribonucleoside-triphosphate reductase activating protein [Clostridium psychrophilum]|uniref:anaerobic ribonucleoside-triphosphate reductase activating protein n=1 Tax=Clostridium psychrophilum TaxID=132926 RepID=UPI001C0C2578|nr:anaerobic ribonucleoside-triphosphate reductase activating protein [Clostridium psychrophilum]MBU3180553.1 anaerobic ribonucleoside-triphosphate reductase activating protein [Clostridium psychrophilum]
MNYASIFFDDTVNGIGFRTSLFVSGCAKIPPCKGCWSPQARQFDYGVIFTKDNKNSIIESLKKPYVKGLSILGGEPMDNLEDGTLINLVKTIKKMFPQKTIFCWSGYKFEDLIEDPIRLEFLHYIDMLRDGEFIEELKDITQYLSGSKNQRIIAVSESLKQNKIIVYNDLGGQEC